MAGLAAMFGSGAMTNPITDLQKAACILSIGTNTTEAHPVIGMQVKQAVRRGARLIVVNPRRIELVKYADIWLRPRTGTNVPLLMGMARVILENGWHDADFIENRCENFEAFKASLESFDLASVSAISGVSQDDIVRAAKMYSTTSPASIMYAMGITQFSHGTDNVMAVGNLAMLTGNVGKPGSGVNPLRGQNNVQGACDMGALPDVYPGYQKVTDMAVREKFEKAWGQVPEAKNGLTLTEMLKAADAGSLRAMYIAGENPVLSDPDISHVETALKKLEFLVVQDIFLTETAKLADVVFPAASFAEKDGTFTNTERRVQRVRQAIEPVGDSRPDWLITCLLAQRMGASGFEYRNSREVMTEVNKLAPIYGGISFERLEQGSQQWPCPDPDHPGTPILHCGQFSRGRGRFQPLVYRPPIEMPDEVFPLLLNTGRSLFQYHTGTMTRKSPGLNAMLKEERVEIHPEDAKRLGIADSEMVKVISRRGEVTARSRITDVTPVGSVYMTFHFAESPANRLTNPAYDRVTQTPEYKACAVRVEKLTEAANV